MSKYRDIYKMRLPDLCTIQTGYTARSRLHPVSRGGVLTIQLRDVAADGEINPDALTRVELGELPGRYFARTGDVVFRSRGDRNTASALDERLAEPALAILPLIVLRPKLDVVTPEYLAWAINQSSAQRYFERMARGTNMRMIPKSSLNDLCLDIPDLKTQRRIAAADRLAKRERMLTLRLAEKRRKYTSLILEERAKSSGLAAKPEEK